MRTTRSVERWMDRSPSHDAPALCFSRHELYFGPRRFEKSLRPTFRARTIEVIAVHHLQFLGDVRRHQLHPERRRDGVGVANLGSVARNHGQNNTFTVSKAFQKIYRRSGITVNHIATNDIVKRNRDNVSRSSFHVIHPGFARSESNTLRAAKYREKSCKPAAGLPARTVSPRNEFGAFGS